MDSKRFRLARWIMAHRGLVGLMFILITAGFAAGLPWVEIRTVFSDLLPADDPFVQTFKDHPGFGDPLTVTVMVKRTDGETIYNEETLQKVWDLTRDIDLVPGVNHDAIISITTEKARYAEATPQGINMRPLMGDSVPTDPETLASFHQRVDRSPAARKYLVSEDDTATLINAAFHEHLLEYDVVFEEVRKLAAQAEDANHEIHLVGQPVLTGWVYKLQGQTYAIFGVTLLLLLLALIGYMRNVTGVTVPVVVSTVAAIWGFGLVGWISSVIEPLLMVVPLLLVARSFSHCVQFTERFYEILEEVPDKVKAAEITMGVMMAPSVLGIITDALGILFIGLAPIPAMERFALFAGFWALSLAPMGVVLISILLSYLPTPPNIESIVGDGAEKGIHRFQRNLLERMSVLVHGNAARLTGVVVVVVSVAAIYTALQIRIGNPVEGSNLLWKDSEFNTGVRTVNNHFPGVNSLEIVLDSKDDDSAARTARSAEAYRVMREIQRMAEKGEGEHAIPARATRSFADFMEQGNRLYSGGHPKWLPLDPIDRAVTAAAMAISFGQNPVNFSQVADFKFQDATVSLFYRDNKQETVDGALAAARNAVDKVGVEHEAFTVRLASGTIALQEAMNSVVERYHWFILVLLAGAIFVIATYAYRSPVAALIVLVPVALANFYLTATMHLLGIGLDINSVMVAVLGVGVGIDYGFYLLSRIVEEYTAQEHDWGKALETAMVTTGKAIMFTAAIMLVGILPWYFLSDLKFTADMGLLLAAIMLINMVLALIVLPLLVWFIKPRFVTRDDLMVGENVDLSAFRQEHREQQPGQGGEATAPAH
ncbi:RND efflux transporter [Salinisphaera sp. PC39]|uniref:efflux RND transporter permease subunit n=1 Tax=Salinisphaera sp. PC39 TaxID=1304156 RepID=UPI00334035D1